MKLTSLLAATTVAFSALSMTARAEEINITAMTFGLSEYMANWVDEMNKHPMVLDGSVSLTVLDGRFDAQTQSDQIDTAITRKADAIIISPLDAAAASAPIERAVAAGIPVITAVTSANTDKIFADIVTDNVKGGTIITEKLVEEMGGAGNVVLLEGPIGQSTQIARREGIDTVLAAHPDVKILASKTANWQRSEGMMVMENWLSLYGDSINGVIAQNDEMALGAIQAIEAKGLSTDSIRVVSIDGIVDGLRAVEAGKLFTVYKPSHEEGQGAVDLALRAIKGESYEPLADFWGKTLEWEGGTAKNYDVPWIAVTKENVNSLLGE